MQGNPSITLPYRVDSKHGIPAWMMPWAQAALLILLALAAFWPALSAGFIWDDGQFLTANPLIADPHGWLEYWHATASADYYPLTSDSFWFQAHLLGMHPFSYHLVNILLHGVGAIALWRVLLRLKIPGAYLAAMIFTVHPVNVASVAWVAERKNTLSLPLYALAALAYLKFDDDEGIGWYWTSLLAYLAAMLCKTSLAALPVILLVLLAYRCGTTRRRDWLRLAPMLALAAILSAVTVHYQTHNAISGMNVRPEGAASRLAAAGWAIWFYLGKTIWPVNLMMVYPRWQVDPHHWWVFVPDVMLVALGFWAWMRRRSWGGAVLAAACYLLALAPVLGVFDIYYMLYSLVADHWQYAALIVPIALAVAAAEIRWGVRDALRLHVAAGALVGALVVMSYRQSELYHDRGTLFADNVAKNPHAWVAMRTLGDLASDARHNDEAIVWYQRAIAEYADASDLWMNYGNALMAGGDLPGAIAAERRSIALLPVDPRAWINLGNAELQSGNLSAANDAFAQAVKLDPDNALGLDGEAVLAMKMGDTQRAMTLYRAAIKADPLMAAGQINLANMLYEKGRYDEAAPLYQQFLLLPRDAAAPGRFEQARQRLADCQRRLSR